VVRDGLALDKADATQLGQSGQLLHTCVSQAVTASQIDVSNAVARLDELNHCRVGDV
jgi:hypothetical protein